MLVSGGLLEYEDAVAISQAACSEDRTRTLGRVSEAMS